MESNDEEWGRKGATLSDKTARSEFGLTQDEIIAAIDAGKLQYRPASMHGNPWLRLLRREVEELVRSRQGEQYLREYWPGMSPGANAGSRVADGVNLLGVEGLKDLPAPRKVRCKVAMPTPARREISAIDISAPGSANAERAAAPWLAGEPGISGRALARRCTTS